MQRLQPQGQRVRVHEDHRRVARRTRGDEGGDEGGD